MHVKISWYNAKHFAVIRGILNLTFLIFPGLTRKQFPSNNCWKHFLNVRHGKRFPLKCFSGVKRQHGPELTKKCLIGYRS
jgi:hypothetical protein